MGNKLYIGGLPWAVTSEGLKEIFEQHGEVVEAKVITDRMTGRSRGFGFVTYASEDDAKKACEMNGQEVQGRTIRVDFARESRGGGGGDRRFGGGGGGRGYDG